MGRPELIVACSTCYSVFKTHVPEIKMQSLWQTLDTLGLHDSPRMEPFAVAVHDPCTSRHEERIHESVRNILGKLGYEIHELPLSRGLTECCGFGGLMYFAIAKWRIRSWNAEFRRARTITSLLRHVQGSFQLQGKPTWHLLDLVFGQGELDKASQRGPDYSQRRENRARLKQSLLETLWGADVATLRGRERMKLSISEHVRQLMERRMILVDDLKRVIDWAETTGNKLVSGRPATFWLITLRPP